MLGCLIVVVLLTKTMSHIFVFSDFDMLFHIFNKIIFLLMGGLYIFDSFLKTLCYFLSISLWDNATDWSFWLLISKNVLLLLDFICCSNSINIYSSCFSNLNFWSNISWTTWNICQKIVVLLGN